MPPQPDPPSPFICGGFLPILPTAIRLVLSVIVNRQRLRVLRRVGDALAPLELKPASSVKSLAQQDQQ